MSRCLNCIRKGETPLQDIYAYNPTYEWTAHKTRVGMVLSYLTITFLLFYIAITMRDYIVRPPELVSQGDIDILQVAREIPFRLPTFGLRVGYTNGSGTGDAANRVAALANVNPYVRFQIRHVVMNDQERVRETELEVQDCVVSSIPSLCPIVNDTFRLQGTFYKQHYEFIEILISKCTGEDVCAPLSVINDKIQSGEFRIRAQVSMEAEQFDVELFHETGSGFAISNRSFEYFGLPNVEVQSDIFMQARRISKEQRYAGSPPLPETEINVLSLRGRETNYLPRTTNETNVMTFVIRLADNVRLEEVSLLVSLRFSICLDCGVPWLPLPQHLVWDSLLTSTTSGISIGIFTMPRCASDAKRNSRLWLPCSG